MFLNSIHEFLMNSLCSLCCDTEIHRQQQQNKSDQNPPLADNYHGTLSLTKEELKIIQTENCQNTKHKI